MRGKPPLTWRLAALALSFNWVGLVLAQTPAADTGKTVTIRLRASAAVNEPIVAIGSVADLEGGEPSTRQRISDLDVAEVSRVGQAVMVTREQVAFRIQLAGFHERDIRVEGPAHLMVKLNAVELTEQQFFKAAQQAVLQKLKVSVSDVEFRLLEPVRLPTVRIAPNDDLRLLADSIPQNMPSGKMRIDVAVLVNGQRCATATVMMEGTHYRLAAVVTRRLEANEMLQEDNVRPERRLFRGSNAWLPYSDQLLGKRVVRSIAPGHAIASADLTLPLDDDEVIIHTRDTVKLLANVGNLRITTVAEAMQDGKVGQLIRVRNIDSGKQIVGRVVDRCTVEVDY